METESLTLTSQGLRVLRLYHLYRLTIGLALVVLTSSNLDDNVLKLTYPDLFHIGCWGYLMCNILIGVLIPSPSRRFPLFSLAVSDILMLSGLFYTSGGIPSGIGNLMVIAVAITNVLLRGRVGLLIAALAAIGIIYPTIYISLTRATALEYYLQAGGLGALSFASALLIQALARRQQMVEKLAARRATAVANLEELNALILQRMPTGILVLDNQQKVMLANQSASSLLGEPELQGRLLGELQPALIASLQQWQRNPAQPPLNLKPQEAGPNVQPSFINLQRGAELHTLVFLEDLSQITQQAQQLKLAALGRLAAGIAHEVRNPLGAISHAAQLLLESEQLDSSDRRLTQIITDQSKRMNLVIENVLELSRRRHSKPQLLDLKYWLQRICAELRETLRDGQQIHVAIGQGSFLTNMDPHQLTQVLTNLIQNALRYSTKKNGRGQVWLRLQSDQESKLPVLEILDDGPGISAEQRSQLFEPFFTTESTGTGLGLYISRELCELNQAHLNCKASQEGGYFCITFAHPYRESQDSPDESPQSPDH